MKANLKLPARKGWFDPCGEWIGSGYDAEWNSALDEVSRLNQEQPSPAPELERPEVVTHSDDAAVDRFSASMKQKLEAARAKGRSGWDDPSSCDVAFLAERLIEHLGKGNAGTFEDVANFAMMLHQRGAHPQVLAEAAGAIERDYLRIIQAQEEKWSGRFEVLDDEAKTLRRERDAAQARVEELETDLADACASAQREELRANGYSHRLAELEKQEPVAWALQRKRDGFVRATWHQKPSETQYEIAELDGDVIAPLYAAPAAQAGQVPELDQLYSMLGAEDQVGAAKKIAELVGCQLSRSALTKAQMRRLYENSTDSENERLGFAAFARLMRRAEAVHQIAAAPAQGE